ncbi:LysR family transcriptional regulator [Caldimonas tepidiphila]|uniref:LysR family transcriptional regulator n=1 Tax=Caldimonas tepidiphila TaxID=2315841 RepID=UPI000E5A8698|nr:LysR family transcriptional regulator [Caldimonas tepidiphila]
MNERRSVLTPDALTMMDAIARTGSFAAAAREIGKVPSALTYSVRQLEEALDVLLFDRRSRQARLTAAGEELLHEGRRLLQEIDAVANRVQRVATGWETQLTIAVDNAMAMGPLLELVEAFYATPSSLPAPGGSRKALGPPTRLKLRNEVLSGTWEALLSGQADLAIGTSGEAAPSVRSELLGELPFVFVVAPHHPLAAAPEPLSPTEIAAHRIIAVADTARELAPLTIGVLPGQDVLTMPTLSAKLEAQLRGLGCGSLPEPLVRRHVQAGRLVVKATEAVRPPIRVHYAWRQAAGRPGLALAWWLDQLRSPATRRALLEQHEGLIL